VWGLAVSAYFVAVFHRTSLGVASLEAERRFHIGPSLLATFVSVQLGLYAAMQIPTGAMADRFGPRRMLTAALVFLAGGEALFGWGNSVATALAGRALVGIGDGLTFLNVLRLVQNWFPASRYGLLTALTSFVGGVGQLVSTEPLRLSLSSIGWVATFTGSAAITAAIAVVVTLFLGDRPDTATPLPLHLRPSMLRSVRHAMRTAGTWRGMWVHFTLTGPFVVFTALWGYPYLVRAQHYSGRSASLALGLVVLSAVSAAPLVGLLMVRAPRARVGAVKASALVLLVMWVVMLSWGPGQVPVVVVVVFAMATGAGASLSVIAFDLAREANPPERGGAATGVVNIGGFACAVIADLTIGWILDALGHGGHGAAGYRPALAVVPVLITLGLVQFWRLGRRHAVAGS
jgi:sugar phosphate permease